MLRREASPHSASAALIMYCMVKYHRNVGAPTKIYLWGNTLCMKINA